MRKGGISAVVATVLIILIVVVAVGVLWGVVLPLFRDLDYLDYSDVRLNIVLQGYTVYYPAEHFAFVQIERRQDEVDVTGLEIGFIFGGTTKTYQTLAVPSPGGKHSYKFNFSADGIPVGMIPDKVNVAPIFILDNKVKLGKILDEVDMPIGEVHLSEEGWEEARLEAENNTLKGALYTYYLDEDRDGYGGAGFEEVEKGMNTTGYISRGGDCNDVIGSGEAINPGAGEIANNHVDENCDDWMDVDSCMDLNYEGGRYHLTGDVSASEDCFIISANDVTFDLGGYTLTGLGSGRGVNAYNVNGLSLSNGVVTNFQEGVYIDGGNGHNIEDVRSISNPGSGFYLEDCQASLVSIEASDNGAHGLSANIFSGEISGSDFNSNGDHGIYLVASPNVGVLSGVRANGNGGIGINLVSSIVESITSSQICNNNLDVSCNNPLTAYIKIRTNQVECYPEGYPYCVGGPESLSGLYCWACYS